MDPTAREIVCAQCGLAWSLPQTAFPCLVSFPIKLPFPIILEENTEMSIDQVNAFYEHVHKDEKLAKRLMAIRHAQEGSYIKQTIEIAAEHGFVFTRFDYEEAVRRNIEALNLSGGVSAEAGNSRYV